MTLDDYDRKLIADARELGALEPEDMRGFTGEDDQAMAYAVAFGRAKALLRDLAGLAERVAAGTTEEDHG